IEYAKNFRGLYSELFPRAIIKPDSGNVIAIYTHAQQGLHGIQSPKGIMKTTVPVFSPSKEFYTPKYDAAQQEDHLQAPDLRSVIHWQPILKTDGSGIAKTSFYNTDITGEVLVIVEAIAENGVVGYQEFSYKVQ